MRRIEFHDRAKEKQEIGDILGAEPSLITFVCGPINSGKTTLITHLIEELPADYVVFYINLRTKLLSSYGDFIESLFEMEIETGGAIKKGKETLAELVSGVTKVAGIPITREFIDYVFKDNKPKNAFSYMLKLFEEVKKSGKQPVLVLDELQKIGDVKLNGPLIYELFNFFIDLTKELHLCHVFAATSDSLFIEQVYSQAMLEGRCRYLLVDDFDRETTMNFLDKYNFSDAEKEAAWDFCGGKPVCLVELVNSGDRGKKACEMFNVTSGRIETELKVVNELGAKIKIGDNICDIHYPNLIEILRKFVERDEISINEIDEISKRYLVKENILFVDPLSKMIKPQSQLNLSAIREVMRDA
ncbi:MAG: putative ATP-binding protein [Candidatus Methanogaster sp.]|nr:MAG: putative ATP-binding protein [ANME-2 cluster archaeon]